MLFFLGDRNRRIFFKETSSSSSSEGNIENCRFTSSRPRRKAAGHTKWTQQQQQRRQTDPYGGGKDLFFSHGHLSHSSIFFFSFSLCALSIRFFFETAAARL